MKQSITIRLDPDSLEKLKKEAKEKGLGYQTMISSILNEYVVKDSPALLIPWHEILNLKSKATKK